MTVDEYATEIAAKLVEAHNARSQVRATAVLQDADRTIAVSKLATVDEQEFWRLVGRKFRGGRLLIERQENSSLHALMQAIEAALAQRQSGS